MKEDTKSVFVGLVVISFIGGFFFPPLFAVGVVLLWSVVFPRGELAEHARRIRNKNRLGLITSYLLRPIQAKLNTAISLREIEQQLEEDPGLAETFKSIEIDLPKDDLSVDQPLNIEKEIAGLASLLPMDDGLALKVSETQKKCASEIRRIRERLQADSALLRKFQRVKISNACENFDAFKAFASLGGAATEQARSLVREVDAFQGLLRTDSRVCLMQDVSAVKPTVTPRGGTLKKELFWKYAKNQAGRLNSPPVQASKAATSQPQIAQLTPRPAPSTQTRLPRQSKKPEPQRGSASRWTLREALDAHEGSRCEEREASYEMLREELAAVHAESGLYADDPALGSWQEELGGTVFREAHIQPEANEELLLQLRRSGVKKLYHFTDRQNIQSIIGNGGLYSWDLCETSKLVISRPGGSALSRQLDRRKGLQTYVRLGFAKDHPMMYTAIADGRIDDPVILEIDLDVVRLSDVLFSDRNAVSNGANVGPGLDALRGIHFDVIQRGKWHTEEEKGFYQAEVLVRDVVPGYLIRHEGRLVRTGSDHELDDDIPF